MVTLQKYSGIKTKHTCPSCGKQKVFVRYVDENKNEIADYVGRCDREIQCGYHYKPKQFFQDNGIKPKFERTKEPLKKKDIHFFTIDKLKETGTATSPFHLALIERFGQKAIESLRKYFVGTQGNKTIFWRIDSKMRIRCAKAIQYDGLKRSKTVYPYFIKPNENDWSQCLFGEHLINGSKKIGLVESEKTAIICDILVPSLTWVATGGKNNLKQASVLIGKQGWFYPDCDTFDTWVSGCKELGLKLEPYDLRNLTSLSDGDLADVYLNEITQ